MMILICSSSNLFAAEAVLAWNQNTEADLSGYKVYYGTQPGVYTQSITVGLTSSPSAPQYTVGNLNPGTTYYFAVTSYDPASNESGYSNEVSKTLSADALPPTDIITITDFKAVPEDGQISLSWTNPADPNYAGVRIRFRTDGTFPTDPDDGDLVGDFPGLSLENESYVHTDLQNDKTYYYSAFSYDAGGQFSSTAYASAALASKPSLEPTLSSQEISGGCGMVRPGGGGNPAGPGQAGDIVALLSAALMALMRRKARVFRKAALVFLALLLMLGLRLPNVQAQTSPPPLYDVLVVLGNGGATNDIANYRPTDEMRRRTKWAGYLFLKANIASRIIVSGGGQWDSGAASWLTSEAASMKMMLTDLGIDPSKIILEPNSSSTTENAAFSSSIIISNGWKTVGLASNNNTCWGNDGQAIWAAPLFDSSLQVFPLPYRLTPVADAGPSKTVAVNTTVSLLGSAFDLSSCALVTLSSVNFQWEQIGGPSLSLVSANAATLTFTPTQLGTYRFRLVVTNGAEGGGLYQYLQDDVSVHVTQTGFPGNNPSIPKGINGAIFGGPPSGPGEPGSNLIAVADTGAALYREGYLLNLLIAGGEKDGAAGTRSRDNSSAGMIATNLFFRSNIGLSKITRNDTATDLTGKISWVKTTAQSRGWTQLALIAGPGDMPTILSSFSGSGITVYPVVADPIVPAPPGPPAPGDTTPPAAPTHLVVQ